MLKKVLIANRGEIARRIVRTARRLGVATVAVYSEADARALHVCDADEAVAIGLSPATESYLRIDRIIAAARATGADAIHPGYGFLAENPALAEACAAAGLAFVGPSADAMRRLGSKDAAKAIAEAAGVRVVPGWRAAEGAEMPTPKALAAEAARIGFPVLIKAVAGGGGRGMRLVERRETFHEALESARREAAAAFGDDRVLIEKLIVRPRHIEVQVLGDRHGSVVHLFERDCTLQRRNQKVIEEAPAPGMSAELRAEITGAAIALARSVGYEGAGTVEFLVEGGLLGPRAPWYFIEMNTRLQVEHPVTEAITGLDLVEWQLRVAAGEPLPLAQDAIGLCGHAVEARIYAEDPATGFLPSVGRLVACSFPAMDGLRVDTGVTAGDTVSPYYDPMIAKLIASGPDRAAAFDRLSAALGATVVAGPRTNAAFLRALTDHADVRAVRLDTGLIGREMDSLVDLTPDTVAVAAGVAALMACDAGAAGDPTAMSGGAVWPSPWSAHDGFQLGPSRVLGRKVSVDGEIQTAAITWGPQGPVIQPAGAPPIPPEVLAGTSTHDDGARVLVLHRLRQTAVSWPVHDVGTLAHGEDGDVVRAPINGRIAKVVVAAGQALAKGDRIAIVEAMKMEHVVAAPREGVVAAISVSEGQQVTEGTLIATLAAAGHESETLK